MRFDLQAQSGIGKFIFNTQLPESATNLGLGAVAFPGETKNDLLTTVEKNITLFLEQQFGESMSLRSAEALGAPWRKETLEDRDNES